MLWGSQALPRSTNAGILAHSTWLPKRASSDDMAHMSKSRLSCKAVFISTHAFCNFSFSHSFPHPSVGGERMVVRMLSCWTGSIYYSCLLRRQKILTFTRNFLCLMSSEIHQYCEQQTTSFNSYILNRYN